MTPVTFAFFVLGLACLLGGAELLVRGAVRLATAVGLPSLLVGLTVVALATSAPEISVTLLSTLQGQPDLALGNVVGSNTFNILFILGIAALIAPAAVSSRLIRLDVPFLILISLLVLLLSLNGRLSPWEGAGLLALSVLYVGIRFRVASKGPNSPRAVPGPPFGSPTDPSVEASTSPAEQARAPGMWRAGALVILGLGLLFLGSRWLVDAAVELARGLGVGELVIGLTLVSAGTSLPEVATSVLAGLRGHREMAVGNLVGSNIFNLLVVLGLGASLSPGGLAVASGALHFDLPVMVATAVACLPIFFTGSVIDRWEGGVFVAYYGAYLGYLLLAAADHGAAAPLRTALLYFVLPLTALTFGVIAVREARARWASGR